MGSFYLGFGGHKSHLGHCEDGIIYSGSGNRTPIGRYENGSIYNQFKEYVGSYSGGSIYNSSRTHVASYDGGTVYNRYLNATVGREQIGSYDDNPAEAAALVLLFLSETATNSGNTTTESNINESYVNESFDNTTYYSSSDEGGGFFSFILSLLLSLLIAIVKFVFVKVIPFLCVYVVIPQYVFGSLLGYISLMLGVVLFELVGLFQIVVIFEIPLIFAYFLFIPYYIFVIAVKVKTKCSWKDVLKMFWKWFLKGPFAYPELINIMEENNIMPKATKIANKLINFFKEKFSKKAKQ